jgi:hypothetical protein
MEIAVTIEGTSPLMCNRFTDKAQLAATEGKGSVFVGDKGTPQTQAEERLYLAQDGLPCIPQPNMFRCLIDGGAFVKAGRSKVTTVRSSIIPACLDLAPLELKIKHPDPWSVDARPVRNPATGGRFLCFRPIFHDWSISFDLSLDTSILTEKYLREVVDNAGKRVGLGDFRPACKGPFGKFVVTKWEVQT